jgi:hypothetical protein
MGRSLASSTRPSPSIATWDVASSAAYATSDIFRRRFWSLLICGYLGRRVVIYMGYTHLRCSRRQNRSWWNVDVLPLAPLETILELRTKDKMIHIVAILTAKHGQRSTFNGVQKELNHGPAGEWMRAVRCRHRHRRRPRNADPDWTRCIHGH